METKFDKMFDCLLNKRFVFILLIFGVIITIGLFIILCSAGYGIFGKGEDFQFSETGQFGDFIGGVVGTIFALAGTILIYLTFCNQKHINEWNTMLSMSSNIEKLVREFKIDVTNTKDNSRIQINDLESIKELNGKNIEEHDFINIYKRICYISNLCLLALEFIKKYSDSDTLKDSYKSTFLFYASYVCEFWGLCVIEDYNKSAKIEIYKQSTVQPTESDVLKLKQNEINNYINDFKKHLQS